MLLRIWTAYAVELERVMRLKQTYIGPLLLALLVLCSPLLHETEWAGNGAYHFLKFVTPSSLGLLGLLLELIFCAGLVAPELGNGSIRQVLVRPLRRHEYILSKLLVGISYAVLLTSVVAGFGWGMALCLGELQGITYGGDLVFTASEMRNAYLLGFLLALAPQCATAAYALMISTWTKSPLAAVSMTVGSWFILDMVKYPLHMDKFLFSTYMEESPWRVFVQCCGGMSANWFPMAGYCLAASGGAFVLCSGIAVLVVQRRNLSL